MSDGNTKSPTKGHRVTIFPRRLVVVMITEDRNTLPIKESIYETYFKKPSYIIPSCLHTQTVLLRHQESTPTLHLPPASECEEKPIEKLRGFLGSSFDCSTKIPMCTIGDSMRWLQFFKKSTPPSPVPLPLAGFVNLTLLPRTYLVPALLYPSTQLFTDFPC